MSVTRDPWGVPHIVAGGADELAYEQGRNAATDRAWQIEVERWRSVGRLAERLGPQEVGWDRFARRVRLDDTAQRCYRTLSAETQRWLVAYTDGVNSALTPDCSPEFHQTGTEPGPWQPWSPLGVFLVQHILFGTFPTKLWRAHIVRTLGPDALDLFMGEQPSGSGSNAWLGDGVIAGDPHRVLELPGVYQQIRLTCDEFDVIGLAFPGVPGVAHFGHTGAVAWAVTNAVADYQDVYREQIRRAGNKVQLLSPDGWADAEAWSEQILVRGADAVSVEIIEGHRGPLIDAQDGEGLSLATPTRRRGDLGFDCLLPLLRSRTAHDVARALQGWVEPVNSVLVADATGTALRLVAGRVPMRSRLAKLVLVPAWEAEHAWTGYADLPRVEPIAPGTVAANDRRPDVADLGVGFAPPHRARRIRELLAAGTPPEEIHMDVVAPETNLTRLWTEVSGIAWDRRMDSGSRTAGHFSSWRTHMVAKAVREVAALSEPSGYDPLFAAWTDPVARVGYALATVIAGLERRGRDVVRMAREAFADACDDEWGEGHTLYPVRAVPDPMVVRPLCIPLAGDTDCVLATAPVPGVTDVSSRGPVARYVFDIADRDRSRWIVPFGASGRPGDPHFADQLPLWAAGRLIPVTTTAIHTETVADLGTLALTPVDADRHAPLIHRWVTQPRNRFWGMADHTLDDVREVYTYLDSLDSHDAYLLLLDGAPIGIFQTYAPEHDPVGEYYDVRPGDLGMHLLLAPSQRPPRGLTAIVSGFLARHLFADPACRRVIAEPDVRNEFAKRQLLRQGFTFGPEIDKPEKRAQLAFLTRTAFEAATDR